ncbi:MAG TPA: amidohydrolase family protein [Polyangia bacterium]|nr:amidohydrolase family protein [Polyangia bacterium]
MRIVSAPAVVPMVPGGAPWLAEGAVALDDDDTVRAVGPRAELRRRFAEAPEVRAEGALLPGLVNAHAHLELSGLLDRAPGGAGFVAWVGGYLGAAEEEGPEARRDAALRGAADMVRFGTAAVGDVGASLAAMPGIAAAGLRGTMFHELLGSRDARTGDALADAARERALAIKGHPWPLGLGYVPAPHAPYSADPELLRRIFAAAARTGLPTSIHVAEDEDEVALLADGTGRWPDVLTAMGIDFTRRVPRKSPVAYLAAQGAFAGPAPPLLVHMVHASADDRRRAREAGATAVLCPRSNLHIGGRLPDVPALLADGVALALGTDSLASTPDLSLFGEVAALRAAFPAVPALTWLAAATSGGARALRLEACGALASGRRPGVVDVAVGDPAAPLESLVRDPLPPLRWMARA